jgi:sigma-54 dependent transcriptional regulator, acetoin dehydrogenase operon transcriptional activator AcoR
MPVPSAGDLFYRLKGAEGKLPALRERHGHGLLAAHLLGVLARKRGVLPAPSLAPEVLGLFEQYAWPGNVRELNTLLDVALILAAGGHVIELGHLPPEFRHSAEGGAAGPDVKPRHGFGQRRTFDRSACAGRGRGNVSLASKRLGVARSTLYRMLRRHGL